MVVGVFMVNRPSSLPHSLFMWIPVLPFVKEKAKPLYVVPKSIATIATYDSVGAIAVLKTQCLHRTTNKG